MRLARPLITLSAVIATSVAVALAATPPAPANGEAAVFGFRGSDAGAELALEQRFDGSLHADDLREWLKTLSAGANQVGAPHNRSNAEYVRDLFRQWGFAAEIEVYESLYPTLRQHSLELIAPTQFKARLRELPVPGDQSSTRTDGMAPYNVFGADGDVTGELVYVNYGSDDDYRMLARLGIDVKGRIVIARYGNGWRGLKPRLAAEHGAIGCIIYSDPRDDGYVRGDPYPKGGWRNADGVQRGSVVDITRYSGDPQSPGVGALPGARPEPLSEADTLMRIPVLPISWGDAMPLLRALGGPVAPADWRGGLALTYHVGVGPARVHLAIKSDWQRKPLYNVIARIPGQQLPDEWVIRGNHRDAWVYGAWDPLSGHVAMLAEAKAIGALLKAGWRPKRTLIYASWDGEEAGLLGSTEWAEAHAAELQRKAALYLNSDESGRGFLAASGSHSLQHLVNEVARDIKDPETGVDALTRLRARIEANAQEPGANDEQQSEARLASGGGDLPIGSLGTGSDYTPFLQHLGIASLNLQYSGEEDQAGVYHSAYDTYEHFLRFGDPGFVYGIALAETAGHVMLRTANAEILPLQFAGLTELLERRFAELRRLVDSRRSRATTLNRLLDSRAFTLASDPTRPVLPPPREGAVPALAFGILEDAVQAVRQSAQDFDAAYARWLAGGVQVPATRATELNALLQGLEQQLTDAGGLPGRPWYRHFLYAPGRMTGYGVKFMPAIREAVEGARWEEAAAGIPTTARLLNGYAARLRQATTLLTGDGAL